MQFKTQSKISYMTLGHDVFTNDEGKEVPYDFTKAHIQTPLADDIEGFGAPYIVYKWGTHDNYNNFVSKYGKIGSFDAEVTWQNQSTGTSSKLVVIDIKPVQTQAKA